MFFHFLKIVVVLLRHETVTTMPRQLPCWILCDSLDVSYLNISQPSWPIQPWLFSSATVAKRSGPRRTEFLFLIFLIVEY